jgi:hypothetical protein
LLYTANMFILMILCDYCLLPGQCGYIIVHLRKVERRVQITHLCALWEMSHGVENLVLRAAVYHDDK